MNVLLRSNQLTTQPTEGEDSELIADNYGTYRPTHAHRIIKLGHTYLLSNDFLASRDARATMKAVIYN